MKDYVWLVYERPDLGSIPKINTGLTSLIFGWKNRGKTVYETHREKTERKVAEKNVITQVPGSFYKNFRIEELKEG